MIFESIDGTNNYIKLFLCNDCNGAVHEFADVEDFYFEIQTSLSGWSFDLEVNSTLQADRFETMFETHADSEILENV